MMYYNSVFGYNGLGGDRFPGIESRPLKPEPGKKATFTFSEDEEKVTVKLELHHIKAAETVLSKGDRVELIPVKDGVKVMRVRREEIKEKASK